MSTHTFLARDSLQAAARTVIITLAGAADAQRLLQGSRSLHTAVAEMEALLDSANDTPPGRDPSRACELPVPA
ncbi:hypothetical protein [Streptomyces flaveolus]|uniref:hypothetical protein n=1 Tax=Streptomyces flaveolus TaxID=67297 RepID=UPI0036F5CDCD